MSFGAPIARRDVAKMRRQIILALWLRGRPPLEGSASVEELTYLAATARRVKAGLIAEIGFNAGFSAQAFLNASPESRVISFDLVRHGYTKLAKRLVDARFPGRHSLIAGDSTTTVPAFARNNPGLTFDLVFIDGGHAYEVARADILNIMPLCHANTAVIIDDLTPWHRWGKGPARAWSEAISDGVIEQLEVFNDGRPVETIAPPGRRVWALGRFIKAPARQAEGRHAS